jgi:putative phosphoesterase
LTDSSKYAIISDIHSNLDALEAVLRKLPGIPILCLGDIVGYGPQPNEVIETLCDLQPLAILMGNHDYAVTTGDVQGFSSHAAAAIAWTRRQLTSTNLRFLSSLSPSTKLELDEASVALYHGSPRDPLFEYVYPEIGSEVAEQLVHQSDSSAVLLGHTHIPMVFSMGSKLLANPGSVGQPRDGNPLASFGVLAKATEYTFEVVRVKYDVESTATRITDSGLPRFLADRLYVGM